jgi:hypothetical protein
MTSDYDPDDASLKEDEFVRLQPRLRHGQALARPVAAAGGLAAGSAVVGALALGALAIGAVAIGAVVIGRLNIGRVKLRSVEIGDLIVRNVKGLG